ncbi:hypothetical protein GWI33_011711 [Rhynchophorus ferrugineus]|uniref:Uncharacterized protein n=1 Tax=Rhynchophorus ferrugineus TaxID=354439 RepID=A0A834IWG7_RHYFE|nr:hypothetical protein GWI33_011711 [Rhynchophorus ferrugineus]
MRKFIIFVARKFAITCTLHISERILRTTQRSKPCAPLIEKGRPRRLRRQERAENGYRRRPKGREGSVGEEVAPRATCGAYGLAAAAGNSQVSKPDVERHPRPANRSRRQQQQQRQQVGRLFRRVKSARTYVRNTDEKPERHMVRVVLEMVWDDARISVLW